MTYCEYFRRHHHLTAGMLAKRADCSRRTIYNIERGYEPSEGVGDRVAFVLGIDARSLTSPVVISQTGQGAKGLRIVSQ